MSAATTLNEPFNNLEKLPHSPCVTLYHRNGRVGCGTLEREVMTGRLLHWSAVVTNGDGANDSNAQSSMPPYVAVLDEADYTTQTIQMLQTFSSTFVAGDDYGPVADGGGPLRGVLVLSTDPSSIDGVTFPSPEPLTPQGEGTPMENLSVGSSYEWNVNNNGDGLTFTDMAGIPTVYIEDSQTATYLRNVASEQANSISSDPNTAVYPSVLSEFNYYMGPSETAEGTQVTSQQCLEWRDIDGNWSPKCLPLGGNSIWAAAGSPVTLGNDNNENADDDDNSQDRPTIILSASIDSTSMFHELSPGANTAASNILSLLLAAELLGSSVNDKVLDQLYSRIIFAFFQGESYGFIGSRLFVKDVIGGFECNDGNEGIPSVLKRKDETSTARACLNPLRTDLTFQNLGDIRGMIAVDQVGNLGGEKYLYVQGGNIAENGVDAFLSEVMIELSANGEYTVQASSASNNNDDDVNASLPPSPVSSLAMLSASGASGVVLTGYDDAFVENSLYHSHLDSVSKGQSIDKDAVAASATLLARSAVAAAYQSEDNEVDAATAAAYALDLLPNAVSSSSNIFENLYNCLFSDGNCETFVNYASVESANDAIRTGINLGIGQPLGKPPNYYVSVYNHENGQGFVAASGFKYGAMDSSADDKDDYVKDYGDNENDSFLLRPSLLEMSINGLLNDFLGRGSFADSDDGSVPELVGCSSSNDCSSVSYCSSSDSNELAAISTCAGGKCICGSRAHYHPAFDEAISPAANRAPGWFLIDDNDQGVSAMITEPNWSSFVGVRAYNDAGKGVGIYASISGAIFTSICLAVVYRLKKTFVKEKVY